MDRGVHLSTQDLDIRESREEDLCQFYHWERLPEVSEFFSIPDGQGRKEVEEGFHRALADPEARQYTILKGADQRPIGRIVLAGRIEGWKVELFRIYLGDLDSRGRGYGRQAMEAVLRLCFQEWGMERVYLDHYTGNPAAQLYLSLGLQYEGILRSNCRKNGKLYDVHLMSILKDEYFARTTAP